MKLLNKKVFLAIGAVVLSLVFVGCGNNSVNKMIGEAKQDISNNEYEKAVDVLQLAINQDPTNKEANDLMQITQGYTGALMHYNDGEYEEANKELNEITADYSKLSIKSDIDELKSEIAFQESKTEVVDSYINTAAKLVKEKKYDEAKAEIEKIDVNSPNKEQKERVNDLLKEINENKK